MLSPRQEKETVEITVPPTNGGLNLEASPLSIKQFTEKDVNTSYFYDENAILKVWDAFIRKRNLGYWVENKDQKTNLFGTIDSLKIINEAAILVDSDGSLYTRKNPESDNSQSLSICSSVNYQADEIGGYNAITSNLELALDQIKSWNRIKGDAIFSHMIQFPYHQARLHWNLGIIELNFDATKTLTHASIKIYDPFGLGAVATKVYDAITKLIRKAFETELIVKILDNPSHIKQQFDGSSCGAISCENGKDIIAGSNNYLGKKYEIGAVVLRMQHLNEVGSLTFKQHQWNRAEDKKINGDKPIENSKLVVSALKDYITNKNVFLRVFFILKKICSIDYESLIKFLQDLKRKESSGSLNEKDKKEIAEMSISSTYVPGQIDLLCLDPMSVVFSQVKKLLFQYKDGLKGQRIENSNLFDLLFEDKTENYKEGTRNLLESVAKELDYDSDFQASITNNNPCGWPATQDDSYMFLKTQLLSYYGFTAFFHDVGCYDINDIQYLNENFVILSVNKEALEKLRKRIISELNDVESELSKNINKDDPLVKGLCIQLVKSEIHQKDNIYSLELTLDIVKLIAAAMSKLSVYKFKAREYKKSKTLAYGLSGTTYQLAILMRYAFEAFTENKDFELLTEADEFGKFDDVVIHYEDRTEIIQAKHSYEANGEYTLIDFCSDPKRKGKKVQLSKYFDTWHKLTKNSEEGTPGSYKKPIICKIYSNHKLSTKIFLTGCYDPATQKFKGNFIAGRDLQVGKKK